MHASDVTNVWLTCGQRVLEVSQVKDKVHVVMIHVTLTNKYSQRGVMQCALHKAI